MLPKHHKTSFFLKAGIFDNLSSFAQLEERISELPTTVEEGDAFEVFAEAYFFTQKIEQAEEVWPFKSIPSGIKEDLSLGTNQKDMGVDGVFKTVSDEFNAYQAKFRTDRVSLTWGELSTFMGLTDNVSQRVLFTNSNDMPSVINDRTGFHCIRGNDLDRLDKNDFETILRWLQSGDIKVERKTPLPHQGEALKDILNTFEDEDRATALMACGTGKTLVSLWVSEQMECQNILVLLPSLTLVRQTLHEWLRETEWSHLSYLCVCSDPTVASKELDSIKINQSDLDFTVTTDSSTVKHFLSQNTKGVRVLFSTYQSAHIVAEGMDNDFRFDLGIFDEAHKTAGREDKKFGFALKDDNLLIKKRLFLTATPRHYNPNKKNEEGDSVLVYSMDNPDVYGKVAHQLSFAKAVRQDIICNYKVIISVVTSEQVSKELLKRGEVLINGDVVNAQQIANHIAFKEAIGKYNIRRIFTFHRSVATAKSFTGKGSEGIRTQLPEFDTFHVNGTMPTAMREGIMNEFKSSDSSVISNARCLTEGVDLPAVDMAAFMSPKKSKVDIVQATGRAMRKDPHNPDKVLGYILVPLYLEITTGESIEEAVSKADFGEVWNVLQALQEQDEMLAEIIRQIQENKGKGGEQKGDDFGDIIDIIGVDISLKTLQESITAVCIDKLGFTWDIRYGELIKYKKRVGDCNVPAHRKEYKQLGSWVSRQRAYRGILSSDRIKRLEDIGFVWDPFESLWEEMLEGLKEYKEEYGDCNVPYGWPENKQLGPWVTTQRGYYKNNTLSKDRIKRLEDVGFEWTSREELDEKKWGEMLEMLRKYKDEYGDCNVPRRWTKSEQLASWVGTQRQAYKNNKLSEDRIECLEGIGFEWNTLETSWDKKFAMLKEYKDKYGNCNVPADWDKNVQLGKWVATQRTKYRKGILRKYHIKLLEDIGFEWKRIFYTRSKSSWGGRLAMLKKYKNKYGNCNASPKEKENKQLGIWVGAQRYAYKNNKLSEERIKLLEEIGFEWDPFETQWEEMFEALKVYKKNNGHCNVPARWKDNIQLANWVGVQRRAYKKGKLSEEHIKHLEDIGFVMDISISQWEEMFEALKEYKGKYGDCSVPRRQTKHKKLNRWVTTQRQDYKNNKLSEDRVKRLEKIGFEFASKEELNENRWEEMFDALTEYKKEIGDCNVPNRWPKNEQLGHWVGAQRQRYKNNKLSEDRIKRLEEIGLVWDTLESQWEELFVALKEYKKKFGDCKVPDGWTKNKQLATWVSNLRTNYKNGTLSEDRIKRLEEIGFVWDTLEAQWEEMFDVLKEYNEKYRNCNVPQRWPQNKQLATWVSNLRTNYKNGTISEDRIKRLEDIGFEWKRVSYTYYRLPWEEVFTMLKEYKDKHGNCNVPSLYKENKQLANWVQTQRTTYKNGTLSEERIKRLEEMGFVWNIRKR